MTAYGNGGATIIAEATDPQTGSIQTATASFNCPLVLPTPTTAGSCYPGSQASSLLSTLTVYNEGLNTTNWLVTAPSATGTPNVLHCGPGSNGAGLGRIGLRGNLSRWHDRDPHGARRSRRLWWMVLQLRTYLQPSLRRGPNTCEVTLTFDDTVGAIFN